MLRGQEPLVDRYFCLYDPASLKYCTLALLDALAKSLRAAAPFGLRWGCARAVLAYRVTLVRGDILSLYTEGREEHLPPRLTLRRAETWDRRTGFLLPLTAFFPPKTAGKKRLVRAARETAREQMETGTAAYYPNYGALLRRAFSSRSFYLADDGLHWFYPMYSVAPAAEGIVDFSLPYGEAGPLLPAEEKNG